MALMEMGVGGAMMSRSELLHSISAPLGLDMVQVTITRAFTQNERPYMATRAEVQKMLNSAVKTSPVLSDQEAVRRSVVAMAKYKRKG